MKANVDLICFSLPTVIDPLSSLDFGGKELINETFDIPVDKLFAALYGNQHPFMKKFLEFRKCTGKHRNEIKMVSSYLPTKLISLLACDAYSCKIDW